MATVALILLIIALLAAHYFIAMEFYKVAAMKGWSQKKYFIIAFLTWIVGYMLIIALPDRRASGMKAITSNDLPEL